MRFTICFLPADPKKIHAHFPCSDSPWRFRRFYDTRSQQDLANSFFSWTSKYKCQASGPLKPRQISSGVFRSTRSSELLDPAAS